MSGSGTDASSRSGSWLTGITVGIMGAVALHGDPTLLKLRESALTGVFGLVCLVSLLTARPAIFLLGRSFRRGRPGFGGPARRTV